MQVVVWDHHNNRCPYYTDCQGHAWDLLKNSHIRRDNVAICGNPVLGICLTEALLPQLSVLEHDFVVYHSLEMDSNRAVRDL